MAENDVDPLTIASPAHFAYEVSGGKWLPFEHLLLLNRKLVDVVAGRINRLMIFMPPRHGKPVCDETTVLMGDGRRVSIKDITVDDEVISHIGVPRRVSAVHVQGELECLEIVTRAGRKVVAALDHPFLTPVGWLKADQLFVGIGLVRLVYQGPFVHDQVVEINPVGKRPCRCLTVEQDHTFTANDIVVHNSELTSRYFPAWLLGTRPDLKVIFTSYQAEYAATWGRRARELLEAYGREMFGIEIGKAADREWGFKGFEGGMISAGVGGPITGRGGHIGIIDDPIKNHIEAASASKRESIKNWYQSTFASRIEKFDGHEGAIILIMTRWHEDDLAGWLLNEAKEGGDQWEVLNLEFVRENMKQTDPLGREFGDVLCPQLFDKNMASRIKRRVGTYWWNALYQQRPSPAEGNIVKKDWWQFYDVMPDISKFDEIVQSWDFTFKDTKHSDFVCGGVWGKRKAEYYLLDLVVKRMNFVASLKAIKRMTDKWPMSKVILVEDKANGPAVISSLKAEIPKIVAVEPLGSKESRAHAVSPFIEAGNVYLPDPSKKSWVYGFIEEWGAFPNGAHDDQVDMTTQFLGRYNLTTRKRFLVA